MHLTITPTHAPNYHTHHSVRRHTIMLRLGYFVALFVAPAAALSGETVVGLASTALRLSRRALQDLPSIPGMPSISGIPSIPGMSMDPSALISQMDLNSLVRMQQLLYCNSDQAKVGPALLRSPLATSRPRPTRPPGPGPPGPPRPSPRVTSRRPAPCQLGLKQIINSAMAAKLDEASAASLPDAQLLVECLCQSSWDVSDPSFNGFVGLISGGVIGGGHMEPAALFDKVEVMLYRSGSRAPAPAWPPAARRAPWALPVAPEKAAARPYAPQSAAPAARGTPCGPSPPQPLPPTQEQSWLAPGRRLRLGGASRACATEPCASRVQASHGERQQPVQPHVQGRHPSLHLRHGRAVDHALHAGGHLAGPTPPLPPLLPPALPVPPTLHTTVGLAPLRRRRSWRSQA